MIFPVDNYKITSPYGLRKDPSKKFEEKIFHNGVDFVSLNGNRSVVAITDGVIIYDFDGYDDKQRWTSKKHSAGNMIIQSVRLDGETYYIRYLHLEENYVKTNTVVKEKDLLGVYGDVGYSFGAHLHVDIYDTAWKIVNPEILFTEV